MLFYCSFVLVALAALLPIGVLAFNANICCANAKTGKYFLNTTSNPLPDMEQQICGQQYAANIPPALNLFVSYDYCATNCSGINLGNISNIQQWAAPLVQFILPSVIFSMMVPRRKKIEFDGLFDFPRIAEWASGTRYSWVFSLFRLATSLFLSIIIMVPVILDTVLWITTIGIGAATMLVGGLYEGHLDYRIIKHAEADNPHSYEVEISREIKDSLDRRAELLVTVVSGNLVIDPRFESPMTEICNSLSTATDESEGNDQRRARLIAMLTSQYSFGSAVGAPVVFYLGALIYTILDLYDNVSTEDASESVALGMEWMTVVHVAIVSCCLLASNNPSTSSAIVGRSRPLEPLHRASTLDVSNDRTTEQPQTSFLKRAFIDPTGVILGWSDAYPTNFQPVWIWSRGGNKMEWIKSTKSWERDERGFRKEMKFTSWNWIFEIFVPTLVLIAAPPAAGAIISYYTPPIGLGCRSLTLFVYAACQVFLAIIATFKNAIENSSESGTKVLNPFSGVWFWAWSGPFLFGSLFSLVGGTVMQLAGVYQNCLCDINPRDWLDPSQATPGINFASDTQQSRDAAKYWLIVGYFATVFMVLVCYVGWWYQRLVRHRFIDAVEDIYRRSNEANNSGIDIIVDPPIDETGSEAPLLRSRENSLNEQSESSPFQEVDLSTLKDPTSARVSTSMGYFPASPSEPDDESIAIELVEIAPLLQ